jgi:hypothetical protein
MQKRIGRNDVKWLVCALAAMVLATPGWTMAETEYRPGADITNAKILKEFDIKWFHVSESCTLRAKAEDRDEKCSEATNYQWVDAGDDYIDLNASSWSGTGLVGGAGTGSEKVWKKPTPTGVSGVTITVQYYDKPTDPHADANDQGIVTQPKQMYSYEAVTVLNTTHSKSTNSPSKTLYETVATAGDSVSLDLAHARITAIQTNVATGTHGPFTASEWGTGTWYLKVNPVGASLDSGGQLKTSIGVDADGHFHASVYDRDDTETGPNSVTVGVQAGEGFAVAIGFTYNIVDTCSAASSLGFGFSSDHLGQDDSDALDMNSNRDCPNNVSPGDRWAVQSDVDYGYNKTVTWKTPTIGDDTKAKALNKMEVRSDHSGCVSPEDDSQARARVDGAVEYSVGVPGYESPILLGTHNLQPESGYDD